MSAGAAIMQQLQTVSLSGDDGCEAGVAQGGVDLVSSGSGFCGLAGRYYQSYDRYLEAFGRRAVGDGSAVDEDRGIECVSGGVAPPTWVLGCASLDCSRFVSGFTPLVGSLASRGTAGDGSSEGGGGGCCAQLRTSCGLRCAAGLGIDHGGSVDGFGGNLRTGHGCVRGMVGSEIGESYVTGGENGSGLGIAVNAGDLGTDVCDASDSCGVLSDGASRSVPFVSKKKKRRRRESECVS